MERSVVTNATCIGCGCVCDDIELHIADDRIVRAERACDLGRDWFTQPTVQPGHPALIDGHPATLDEAISAAVDILRRAHFPLVFGLGQSTCEAMRESIALTEAIGGVIDTHTSLTHGPTKTASQLVGKVACTLGEVRNRADLIVYWGTNPAASHPRHLARYTLDPTGRFISGRQDRTMILVDVRESETAVTADQFLQIRPNTDFEVLTALRAVLRDRPVNDELIAATGLTVRQLRELAERMKRAKFGVLFFGTGLTATRGKHGNAAAALTLVAELNAFTKFVAMPMRDHGNEAGVDHVLSWTTGYPLGVDLSRGYPRSNPGEFTGVDLLTRGDVDAAVIVGEGPWGLLPRAATDRLGQIPTVVLNSRVGELSRAARVHFTTAVTGISTAGTVYRMDKIPLPVTAAVRSSYPSEEEVLQRLRTALVL